MSKKKRTKRSTIESCEGILAVLKAGQRQLEYLAHEHLDFRQVMRLEETIRVGSSPERAEIQRIRLLLDARLDHVAQMRALSSLAPLTLTPMDEKRFARVSTIASLREATPPSDPIAKPEADSTPETAPPPPELKRTPPESEPASESEPLASSESASGDTGEKIPAAEPLKAAVSEESESEEIASSVGPEEDSTGHLSEQEKPAQNGEESLAETASPQSPSKSPTTAPPIPLGGVPESRESATGLSVEILPASAQPESSDSLIAPPPLEDALKTLMDVARKAHSEGELERAIEAYSDLLDQVDTHLPALLARGRCLLEAKDFAASLSDFRRAQRSFPTHPAPLIALGDLFMARKEHAKAIEFFDEAIGIKADHPQARCRRGLAHYHCGRYRQAFLDLQRAYKLDPEIPNIRRLVQMAIRKLEDSD
ncbi:MAG: tetratricopeptide repeat protein [Myxococcota bacterium]|nr:tetratricopeptide repeat protein [Myxococcota bacterium]